MNTEVNLEQIRQEAEEFIRKGRLSCSESVVYTIRKNVVPEMPEELIAASTGFAGGIGGSHDACGAVTGSVICIGYLFGRTQPNSDDPKKKKCGKLAFELQESFKKKYKTINCGELTNDFKMPQSKRVPMCAGFTGEMAVKTARIIAGEFDLKLI